MPEIAEARPEPTVANADLWTRYFTDQWSRWWNPFGVPDAPMAEIAEGTAARVASFLTFVAAGPIAWLYSTSAPLVSEIVGDDERASVRPYRPEPGGPPSGPEADLAEYEDEEDGEEESAA